MSSSYTCRIKNGTRLFLQGHGFIYICYNRIFRNIKNAVPGNLVTGIGKTEISTLINFNRELYTSFMSMLFSLKDYLLSQNEADYFENQPGFIR